MRINTLLSRLYSPAIFIAIFSAGVLISGCGEAASNNSAMNANANKPVNASGNANYANTAANTLNSTANAANSAPPVVITPETLKAALKARLMSDKMSILKDRDWDKDQWIDLLVGDFYRNNDSVSKQKISDTTANVLRTANRMMTRSAQQRLEDSVTSLTKCKTALELMHTATRDSNTTEIVF
ncbi:MAG: hypothetical protein ABL952_04065 [Pyrinomonadaceae bacterium]